ncbi:O-antigen ligase [Lysobacter ruishenii]|uniref:O-antigen ligase n=1 Tax=Aerolutibacter ruishenii TaxID=686800 RepID=A0A562LRY0_9GAMM|nr:O-antigen ligase [Lysobacter ruishenii]
MPSTPNLSTDTGRPLPPGARPRPVHGWRWAPAWILAHVALWPAPGYAEAVLALGALAALAKLLLSRFRGGEQLLSHQAWALTSVMFFAYWLPELVSAFDAVDRAHAFAQTAEDLRYLPFLWLAASAVADERGRRVTFGGLALILAVWVLDALLQALVGTSPLFFGIDAIKQAVSGHGMCSAQDVAALDRLSGVLGPCNLKLGVVVASLSPFLLYAVAARFGAMGWLLASALVGLVVLLAGARAAWLTYALVVVCSGWRLLGWKKMALTLALGAIALAALGIGSPQVRERLARTSHALSANGEGVDQALSGRARIWSAATCMAREHPVNGVGARGFRDAFPACDPEPGKQAAWGEGPAFHAHQIVLEILSETGVFGLLMWLAGAAMAWRAWRFSSPAARERARPAMLALGVTVFPFNTHLAFYSTFWGGFTLLLAALYAGSLLSRDGDATVSGAS